MISGEDSACLKNILPVGAYDAPLFNFGAQDKYNKAKNSARNVVRAGVNTIWQILAYSTQSRKVGTLHAVVYAGAYSEYLIEITVMSFYKLKLRRQIWVDFS